MSGAFYWKPGDKEKICELVRQGYDVADIAGRYGVREAAIRNIIAKAGISLRAVKAHLKRPPASSRPPARLDAMQITHMRRGGSTFKLTGSR